MGGDDDACSTPFAPPPAVVDACPPPSFRAQAFEDATSGITNVAATGALAALVGGVAFFGISILSKAGDTNSYSAPRPPLARNRPHLLRLREWCARVCLADLDKNRFPTDAEKRAGIGTKK